MRRFLKRAALALLAIAVLALACATVGALWLRAELRASLPVLEGSLRLEGLSAPAVVERDTLGVPTIRGANRLDVARATGFVHAEERFFQMDLLRRAAAGELAALFGPALLPTDREMRIHRFRAVAERDLALAAPEERRILETYAAGVNAGLAALRAAPPEYLLLRATPAPWRPEDVTLVVLAMYLDLQSDTAERESDVALLYDALPAELAHFLAPAGSEWDAPVVGEPFAAPPPPPAEVFELRRSAPLPASAPGEAGVSEANVPGSNNWAVAGAFTADGGAWLANDMHLSLRLPNIWFRASLVWPDESDPARERRVTGVTLPGTPPIVAGSNGAVAWGFTNSQGDWADLVLLETDPNDPDVYATPDGARRIETFAERIVVKGAADEVLTVRSTIWGPVFDEDHRGRQRALRWIAHDPEAVDLGLMRMERVRDLDEALRVAAGTRIPAQNCVVVDRAGRIGWTLMGPIPRRVGFDGRLPRSWAAGDVRWDGLLAPDDYPRVVDPPGGRIWTANNRVVDGAMLDEIGDGGFANGARAKQIRDDLLALERATPRDLLAIQLDDRALFLARWRGFLLEILDDDATRDRPRRVELARVVRDGWTGRASIDSAAYRMVRAFRLFLAEDVFDPIVADCKKADADFNVFRTGQWEAPLWALVHERPPHLLDPEFASWDDRLLATVDRLLDNFSGNGGGAKPLAARTWGERNTVRVRHPLSLGVPQLARWLDAPALALPGDAGMPRVQSVSFGASERFVVSPGREDTGIFHMPGGQSGHFLSPYYLAGHEAWARGEPTPFLPGPTMYRLTLVP